MKSNIFKYLLNQMEQNHSFEIKTAILKSLCQMKQPSLSSDLLELLRTTPEQILPILVKNAREIPNDLENKGEVMTEMCLYWLAYMEHGHSGTFLLEFLKVTIFRQIAMFVLILISNQRIFTRKIKMEDFDHFCKIWNSFLTIL